MERTMRGILGEILSINKKVAAKRCEIELHEAARRCCISDMGEVHIEAEKVPNHIIPDYLHIKIFNRALDSNAKVAKDTIMGGAFQKKTLLMKQLRHLTELQ